MFKIGLTLLLAYGCARHIGIDMLQSSIFIIPFGKQMQSLKPEATFTFQGRAVLAEEKDCEINTLEWLKR